MIDIFLVINAGSSSIKFSIFSSSLKLINHGEIEKIFEAPCLTILDATHAQVLKKPLQCIGYEIALKALFDWLINLADQFTVKAVGHRVVHGGAFFCQPSIITETVIADIEKLIPLAPLHQPHNLEAIQVIKKHFPKLKQIACFDTIFHRTQERLATLFAIPRKLTEEGIIRYGFHGTSYEYIASVMSDIIGDVASQRVIAAHLGNGASMCAMLRKKSVATSMGFTAVDGLMMGTRTGRIDPGVLLYLLQEKQYSEKQLEDLLYRKSGLLGVSNISNDVRELLSSQSASAKEAIELFCYRAALEVGSLCSALNGCDALIFTAGIGENSGAIRKMICDRLNWLGVEINEIANENNAPLISDSKSKVIVSVIPTNEEFMIAKHIKDII